MNLPHDPFGHMKILGQASAAERALKQAEAMDPMFHIRKSMGTVAFEAMFGDARGTPLAEYRRNEKLYADAERITEHLRVHDEREHIERLTNPGRITAAEWRWVDAVRKVSRSFSPAADLLRAAESTSALKKYRPFQFYGSLDVMARALADSATLERDTRDWENVQRMLRTIGELGVERNNWIRDGGTPEEFEDDDSGSEIVAAVVSTEIGARPGKLDESLDRFSASINRFDERLERLADLVEALLSEYRSNRPSRTQIAIFLVAVVPYLEFLLTPIYDVYSKRLIEKFDPPPVTQPAREANKSVNLQAREFKLTPMLLSELRFVNCKKDLPLRATPRTNAAKLPMRIPRGQPVQVLETQKSWTKIRWTDSEQNFVIEGWVVTRYLKKFS